MSWTRSAKKPDGTFSYEVRDWNGKIYATEDGFVDYKLCECKAQAAERKMTFEMSNAQLPTLDEIFSEMDDDELLAELMS